MANDKLTVQTADGKKMDAYVAYPHSGRGPAIVVIQEIFGVNPWLRKIADWLASEGYIAVAPDLFHRMEANVQLTDQTEEDWKKAFWFYEHFDVDQGVKDLIDTVDLVRKLPGCNGKVGSIGFCLGGKLAYLMAARSEADANVGYYGVQLEKNLHEELKNPLALHIAEADAYVPHDIQDKVKAALGNNPMATLYVYDGQDHAFAREGGQHYNKEAADLANRRTLEFLNNHLAKADAQTDTAAGRTK